MSVVLGWRMADLVYNAEPSARPKAFDFASNLYQHLLHTKRQCLHFEPKNMDGVVLANRVLGAFGGLLVPVESKLNARHQVGHSCLPPSTLSRS
jgi:hypothetical protein